MLYLPEMPADQTPATGTRADGQLTGFTRSETTFSNRRLFVYPVNSDGTVEEDPVEDIDIKNLTPVSQNTASGYAAYHLDIKTGNYKMYVTANIDLGEKVKYSDLLNMTVDVPENLDNGLPMSCSNNELEVKYGEGNSSVLGDGYISITSGEEDVIIKADLKYALAKVRVTLINDLSPADVVKGIKVSNHIANSTIFPGVRDTEEKEKANKADGDYIVDSGKYYNVIDVSADGIDKTNVDTLGEGIKIPETDNTTPYTHQAVFYVPERLFQTDDDCTTVKVTVGGVEKHLKVGHIDNGKKVVKRSHFYDFVGASDGKFYLQVQPWSIDAMIGSLNGQTTLHVHNTGLDIVAGEKIELPYESNASSVTAKANEFKGKSVYRFEYADGKLIVSLNSELTRQEFDEMYNDEANKGIWNYFTVTAGTLVKKIDVRSISYDEFITLDVEDVTIDVGTQKTSAEYNGTMTVPVKANVKQVKLTFDRSTWGSLLDLQSSDGTSLSSGSVVDIKDGMMNLLVKYYNINSNETFWKIDHDFPVKIEDVNGEVENAPTMTIHVRAFRDKYIIHFRPKADWKVPHIFAYQPLKLPSDFNPSLSQGSYDDSSPEPDQPVGDGAKAQSAAQEFDFSGGIVFKGWDYTNSDSPNYIYQKGRTDGAGFWCFNKDAIDDSEWSPGQTGWEKHYEAIDFAADHRSKITCERCTALDHDRGWPGIEMINEGNGWWKFELSGAATPGRTLIQFNSTNQDNHIWYNGMQQYPGAGQPGMGLFDYPSKEAWIDITDEGTGMFAPDIESSKKQGTHTTTTYRIYWPYNSSNWVGLNVWQGSRVFGNGIYSNWNAGSNQTVGNCTFKKYNNSYAYMEFKTLDEVLSGNVKYQRRIHSGNEVNDGYDGAEIEISFSNFSQSGDIYTYTITSVGAGKGGTPDGAVVITEPTLSPGYQRIYFENLENWSNAYIWAWKTGQDGESKIMSKLPTNSSWFYIDLPKGSYNTLFFRDSDQNWDNKRCENITLGNDDRYYFNKNSTEQTSNRP